jgi:hypothetical protein
MPKPKRKDKTVQQAPGFDGRVIIKDAVILSGVREETRNVRCLPGSFEWSYGTRRNKASLYHAGIEFAKLWERAEVFVRSPNMVPTVATQSPWNGLTDARADAMAKIREMRPDLGSDTMSRLVDYCVMGTTVEEIAGKYGVDGRAMAAVLRVDLQSAARHFRYV